MRDEITCRYCNYTIDKGIKNCPNCNTINPSIRVKEVMVWTLAMIFVMYALSYVVK